MKSLWKIKIYGYGKISIVDIFAVNNFEGC